MATKITYHFKLFTGALVVFAGMQTGRAQQTHHVAVENAFFEPSSLAIEAGDTVIWTNASGFHNVNGTQETFPANPESFGNSTGSDWTYSFVFTTPGTYQYHCNPHAELGMTGEITVAEDSEPTAIFAARTTGILKVYPNPAAEFIHVVTENPAHKINRVQILTPEGRIVQSTRVPYTSRVLRLDISQIPEGIYWVKIHSTIHTAPSSLIIKR